MVTKRKIPVEEFKAARKRGARDYALSMDAQVMLCETASVRDTGRNTNVVGHEGCANSAVKRGVCIRHGAEVIRCSHEGCTNQVQKEVYAGGTEQRSQDAVTKDTPTCNKGRCLVTHGATWTSQARNGGVCTRHGAKRTYKTCAYDDGCTNFAARDELS